MMCQNCQKKLANVHFTQIVNGNKAELYLCEDCSREKSNISFGSPLSLNDFFSGIMGCKNAGPYINPEQLRQSVCEKCGMSYEEFQKTGKLGCNNCYEVFGEKLKPLFRRLHGSIEHNGKEPEKISKIINANIEIEALKGLLNKAVLNEEYETAAMLRDQIRALESTNSYEG